MRKQQKIWLEEHTNPDVLPSLAKVEPGSGVNMFIDFLKSEHAEFADKNVVDIGCGKGRMPYFLPSKT